MNETVPNEQPGTGDLLAELRAGSSVALIELTRLIARILVDHRAYDFRERWDEFALTVLRRLLTEAGSSGHVGGADSGRGRSQSGSLEEKVRLATLSELVGFFRNATEWKADGEVPWCEIGRMNDPADVVVNVEPVVEGFRREIEKLPEQRSQVLRDVYGSGRSFDQVASDRKLPLRLVKRFLRESIWDLRERCGELLAGVSGSVEERRKSCLKSLELDLPAFLVEPHLAEWNDFKTHYPSCQDCSTVVAKWTRVESMVRQACHGGLLHPPAEDLISLHRDGEGLDYAQYISLMRHLDGCPPCGESMSLLSHFDQRPIGELLTLERDGTGRTRDDGSTSLSSRLMAELRRLLRV